jgi:hypothetical protein
MFGDESKREESMKFQKISQVKTIKSTRDPVSSQTRSANIVSKEKKIKHYYRIYH